MKVCAVVDGNPVLELIRGGSLEEYLQQQNSFSDSNLVKVLAEIASGLAHMHELGLIHKDLKPANILLKSRGEPHPVIIDFGSTVPEDAEENKDVAGTELYMAPEMAARLYGKSKKGFDMRMTSKMDIWALGLIIYEMASEGSHLFVEKGVSQKNFLERKQPFDSKFLHNARAERLEKIKKMASLNQACLLREGRKNSVLIEGLFSIAADCLKMQSLERPTAAEVEKRLLDLQTKL
jgi:serine/threonine protein kinase